MEFITGMVAGALSFILVPYIFWVLFVVAIFISGRCVRDENDPSYFFATVMIGLVGFGIVSYFPDLITTLKDSIEFVIAGGVAYLIAGSVYASGKWNMLSKKAADEFKAMIADYNKSHPSDMYGHEGTLYRFVRYLTGKNSYFHESDYFDREGMLRENVTYDSIINRFKPAVEENKARISGWIAYWPLHGLNTVWNFLFEDLVEYVFNTIKNRLQKMTDRHFEFAAPIQK